MKLTFLQKNFYTILSIFFSIGFIFLTYFATADDSVDVQLIVDGCNNNFICEAVIGENTSSCPNDCSVTPPTSTTTTPDDFKNRSGQRKRIKPVMIVTSQVTTDTTAKILWTSDVPVNASISWTSDKGQSGIIQEIGYTLNHSLYITGLSPDSSYTITIQGQNLYRVQSSLQLKVHTQKTPVSISLVQNFDIHSQDEGAVLRWQNPDLNFEYVRIVKSPEFFPQDPYDGEVIYEGSAQSFFDSEIEKDTRYYYSIFVKNDKGFSTGVVDSFTYKSKQEFFDDIGQPVTTFGPIYDSTFISNLNDSDLRYHFHFYQGDNELTQANNTYFVENHKEVVVTADAHLGINRDSQIYISYFNSKLTNRTKDYVFEYDKQQKKFVARFLISNDEPTSPFIIYVRNNQETKGYMGYFSTSVSVSDSPNSFWRMLLSNDLISSVFFTLCFLFLINFWWIILLFRRRKKEEEKE